MATPDESSGSNDVAPGDVDTSGTEHHSRNNGKEIPEGSSARKDVACLETNETQEEATPMKLQPELFLLGPKARDFFVSQGITTVKTFLSVKLIDMATALAKQNECVLATAKNKLSRWRGDVKQRHKTRKEQLVGLHPAFEVFDSEARSFFTAMSIAAPSDLMTYRCLAQVYVDWRRDNRMYEIKLNNANGIVCRWRQSVKRQNDACLEWQAPVPTIGSPSSNPMVSELSFSSKRAFSSELSTGADNTSVDERPAFTVDGRPMSGWMHRKMAKRTFPVPTPASAPISTVATVVDDAQGETTSGIGSLSLVARTELGNGTDDCNAEPERKRHRLNENVPTDIAGGNLDDLDAANGDRTNGLGTGADRDGLVAEGDLDDGATEGRWDIKEFYL
jgi:hypothetical protein